MHGCMHAGWASCLSSMRQSANPHADLHQPTLRMAQVKLPLSGPDTFQLLFAISGAGLPVIMGVFLCRLLASLAAFQESLPSRSLQGMALQRIIPQVKPLLLPETLKFSLGTHPHP